MENHIKFDRNTWELLLLDQRYLPDQELYYVCKSAEDVIYAIKEMIVRGAPAIGVTGAFACLLAAREAAGYQDWKHRLKRKLQKISTARPTAVNLAWAVNRMQKFLDNTENIEDLLKSWTEEANNIYEEDKKICRQIGECGQFVLNDGETVLTHCNAGSLATAGYGTALGVIRSAIEKGKKIKVIADETRPFLQGARLTAYELSKDHIPVQVACDNACALLMEKGLVDKVVVGADRIAANGDTANKIGTYGVAILAKHFGIPFFIAAPVSTIDPACKDGSSIPVEERPESEVKFFGDKKSIPDNVPAFNFAFDITPASLISGIITEKGILKAPYVESIARVLNVDY